MTDDQAVTQVPAPTARRVKRPPKKAPVGEITGVEPTLTVGDVARLYGVDPKTVTRWFRAGRLPDKAVIETPGGHRRFREAAILKQLNDRLR